MIYYGYQVEVVVVMVLLSINCFVSSFSSVCQHLYSSLHVPLTICNQSCLVASIIVAQPTFIMLDHYILLFIFCGPSSLIEFLSDGLGFLACKSTSDESFLCVAVCHI